MTISDIIRKLKTRSGKYYPDDPYNLHAGIWVGDHYSKADLLRDLGALLLPQNH